MLYDDLKSDQVIDTFNTGYYYNKQGALAANSAYIYSDFYPVELFKSVVGLIKNSVTCNIAYFKEAHHSNYSFAGYYLGNSTANTGGTIDRTTFLENMPEGAKYFTISTEQKTTNTVKLYLHSMRIDALEDEVEELTPHVIVPKTMTVQDIMTIYEYWNGSQSKFVSTSGGWRRTPFLDLDVYKRIEATIKLQGNSWPQVVYFDSNRQFTRSEGWASIPSGITTNKYVIERTNASDKYVVICMDCSTTTDYPFKLYPYVDKLKDGDFSMMDDFFTEPRSGAEARLITSNTLNSESDGDEFLMIYCPGNGETRDRIGTIPADALAYLRSHHISIATLTYQAALYGSETANTGWGNDVCYNAICDLYAYLTAKYPFRKDVIIAGGSMGGLTMGQIAYKRPFPIRFCLGVGPAPGLAICWANANSTIKTAMRSAYGLASDGSEDSQFATKSQGYDWRTMGWVGTGNDSQKLGYPNVYLYYGNDEVISGLFGGVTNYNTLRDALLNAGVYSMVKSIGNTGHASVNIFLEAIEDGVFERELKAGEYTTT